MILIVKFRKEMKTHIYLIYNITKRQNQTIKYTQDPVKINQLKRGLISSSTNIQKDEWKYGPLKNDLLYDTQNETIHDL